MVCLLLMASPHTARIGTEKDQAKKELGVRTTCAARRANLAKRVECVELAPALGRMGGPKAPDVPSSSQRPAEYVKYAEVFRFSAYFAYSAV